VGGVGEGAGWWWSERGPLTEYFGGKDTAVENSVSASSSTQIRSSRTGSCS